MCVCVHECGHSSSSNPLHLQSVGTSGYTEKERRIVIWKYLNQELAKRRTAVSSHPAWNVTLLMQQTELNFILPGSVKYYIVHVAYYFLNTFSRKGVCSLPKHVAVWTVLNKMVVLEWQQLSLRTDSCCHYSLTAAVITHWQLLSLRKQLLSLRNDSCCHYSLAAAVITHWQLL